MAVMSSRSMSAQADDWRKNNLRADQSNWYRGGKPPEPQPEPAKTAAGAKQAAGGLDASMQGRQLEGAISGFEDTRSMLIGRGLISGMSETNIRKMVGRAWGIYSENPGDLGKPKRSGEIGLGRSLKTLWGPDGRMQTAEQAAQADQAAPAAQPATVGQAGRTTPTRWGTTEQPSPGVSLEGMGPGYLVNEGGIAEDMRMAAEVTQSGSSAFKKTWDNAYGYRMGRGASYAG